MSSSNGSEVDQTTPDVAFQEIASDPSIPLIDVRTRAEWNFVGLADLQAIGGKVWTIEWREFPAMSVNARFLDEISARIDGPPPPRMFFICRSGARSMEAAMVVAEHFAAQGSPVHCTNVAEGFEGDLGPDRHRGIVNGWKARGLPWRQS